MGSCQWGRNAGWKIGCNWLGPIQLELSMGSNLPQPQAGLTPQTKPQKKPSCSGTSQPMDNFQLHLPPPHLCPLHSQGTAAHHVCSLRAAPAAQSLLSTGNYLQWNHLPTFKETITVFLIFAVIWVENPLQTRESWVPWRFLCPMLPFIICQYCSHFAQEFIHSSCSFLPQHCNSQFMMVCSLLRCPAWNLQVMNTGKKRALVAPVRTIAFLSVFCLLAPWVLGAVAPFL